MAYRGAGCLAVFRREPAYRMWPICLFLRESFRNVAASACRVLRSVENRSELGHGSTGKARRRRARAQIRRAAALSVCRHISSFSRRREPRDEKGMRKVLGAVGERSPMSPMRSILPEVLACARMTDLYGSGDGVPPLPPHIGAVAARGRSRGQSSASGQAGSVVPLDAVARRASAAAIIKGPTPLGSSATTGSER